MGLDLYDRENARAREALAKATKDQADAYRERTETETRDARADRLADVRMRSVELAFRVYKDDAKVFGLDDVLTLADRIARFVGDGEPVQDGAGDLRFYGRK